LEYITNCFLEGRDGDLKEYLIARDVYDRGTDFDSRVDPIVRVEASRLRHKTREYYVKFGSRDKVILSLHPWGYRMNVRFNTPEESFGAAALPVADLAHGQRPGATSVIIMPFEDLVSSGTPLLLGQSISDQVANQLVNCPAFQVVNRICARQGTDGPLAAETTLQGSVQHCDARIRLRVHLVDNKTGIVLWGKTVDREVRDVFATQDDLAAVVVGELMNVARVSDYLNAAPQLLSA
jgi:TolB-like protein